MALSKFERELNRLLLKKMTKIVVRPGLHFGKNACISPNSVRIGCFRISRKKAMEIFRGKVPTRRWGDGWRSRKVFRASCNRDVVAGGSGCISNHMYQKLKKACLRMW